MRTIKLILLTIILLTLCLVAIGNRGLVSVRLVPEQLDPVVGPLLPFPLETQLPLFVIILIAVVVGLLLGYIIEYLRERKYRRAVETKAREVSHWKHRANELAKKAGADEDDVLALLK